MELAARLNGSVHEVREDIQNKEELVLDINTWREDDLRIMKKSVLALINAAGECIFCSRPYFYDYCT